MGTALRDAFLAEAGESALGDAAAGPELDRALEALVETAALAHPELEVSPEALAAAIGRAVREEAVPPTLADLQAADLALACACADANPWALTKFEREYGREVDRAVARVPGVGMDRDDFRQKVREKLFTAAGSGRPRIASYAGRGSLRAWVRVTSMRTALDLTRRRAEPQHRVAEDGDLVDRMAGGTDPELAFMRSRWGQELRALIVSAMERLSPRHRNLLRYHYLHGLSARKISEMYGVHRATTFKWLEEAREELLDRLTSVAQQKLQVGPEEIRSVVAMLGSRLDLSVRRLLGSGIEPEDS
jgi:RNA polymerase sigma-70 factor, ECF subfamily